MKFFVAGLLLAALCASPTHAVQQTPISRVVDLMKGLSANIEKDGKIEEDLYETYVCWAKTVIDTKTATNAAATSRIEELNAYIADIEGGRVEFTDERGTLTKELEEVNSEIEEATTLREKERDDFASASTEMNQAITALASAISTLNDATSAHKEGELVQLGEGEGFSARVAEAKSLERAVQLGEKFLTKGDSVFLRRLLTGDVPNVDWKKLNRKATFKMSYKARSFKIQDLLAKLHATFKANLKEATDKDTDSETTFTTLMEAKNAQKKKTEKALGDGSEEAGKRGEVLDDSNDEVNALTAQKTADEGFITNTIADMTLKKKEWGARSVLRTGELEAISKAIGILHSDEARDMMKASFDSQGLFLFQVSQSSTARAQAVRAVDALRSAGRKSHDRRLGALAARLAGAAPSNSAFEEVVGAIDKMMTTLKSEEKQDLANKEECENTRMADARDAIDKAREIDEESEDVMSLEARIAEISATIKEKEDEIASIQKEVKDATTIRGDEQRAWVQTDKEDKAAARITGMAIGVLDSFYKDNGLMLVQKRMEPVVAGDAPPPPPPTWEAPYGGKTGESTGIIAILNMIKEDIEKDCEKAKTENDEATTHFLAFKTKSEAEIVALKSDNTELSGERGDKQQAVKTNKRERSLLNDGLKVVVGKMNAALEGCDFIAINYPLRLTNRQLEMDGLNKAKAILSGAAFGL